MNRKTAISVRKTMKPGAERAPLRPDSIAVFTATEPTRLMEVLDSRMR